MDRRTSAQWAIAQRLENPAVDVLIPTRNRAAELAVTLSGLAAQDSPAFRVVVSDQSDGLPAWDLAPVPAMVRVLRAQGTEVELLQHLPRQGMAEHRQFLLDQARTDKVLFLEMTYGWSPAPWAG